MYVQASGGHYIAKEETASWWPIVELNLSSTISSSAQPANICIAYSLDLVQPSDMVEAPRGLSCHVTDLAVLQS